MLKRRCTTRQMSDKALNLRNKWFQQDREFFESIEEDEDSVQLINSLAEFMVG